MRVPGNVSVLGTVIDVARNKKTFGGAPISPERKERLAPELRYGRYTNKVAKLLMRKLGDVTGRAMGKRYTWSPAKFEYALSTLTGGLSDAALRISASIIDGKLPESHDFPILKRFSTRAELASRHVEDFWNAVAERQMQYDTMLSVATSPPDDPQRRAMEKRGTHQMQDYELKQLRVLNAFKGGINEVYRENPGELSREASKEIRDLARQAMSQYAALEPKRASK